MSLVHESKHQIHLLKILMQGCLEFEAQVLLLYPVCMTRHVAARDVVIIVPLYPHVASASLVGSNIKNSKSKNDKV